MKEPFLSYREYREICSRQKITDKTSQDTLVDFLNDLGTPGRYENRLAN